MSELLVQIRKKDDYRDFYDTATRIRNQSLLTDSELESLNHNKKDISQNETRLLTEAWQSSYLRIILQQLKNQADPLEPTLICRLLKEIKETDSSPAYKVFGHYYSNIDQILCILYNEPITVAVILNNIDQNEPGFNDSCIQSIFNMLYSSALYPEDELRVSQALCEILKIQLCKSSDKMRMMLRKENSMSTRFYRIFVETSHPIMVYLTRALRKGVLAVVQLGNFWLDIDEKQSTTRFLRDHHQDSSRLPEYRALVVSKLVELVDIFLEEINEALPILPASLHFIIRSIFTSLYEVVNDVSAIELSHACKDMIISNLICPAIISPQKFGIIDNDVRIGTIVNHNLVQSAMIIQMVSLREFETPPIEYKEFLTECRNTHLISEMMDVLLMDDVSPEVEIISNISNGTIKSDFMSKNGFVGSVGDVNLLIKMLRNSAASSDDTKLKRLVKLCNRLPDNFTSNSNPSNSEQGDTSPRFLALKNIHKKVHQSLTIKRSESSPIDLATTKNCSKNTEAAYFEKESFDIFHIDYDGNNYEECPPEEPSKVLSNQECEVDSINVQDEPIVITPLSENVGSSEITGAGNVEEEQSSPVMEESKITTPTQLLTNESRGGLSRLRSLGDRMKRGITQSNTISDIRVHLRRSASAAKSDGNMPTSSSQNAISEVIPSGPRDDILEKYSSMVSIPKIENNQQNLIDFDDSSSLAENYEPYYSAQNLTTCRAFKDTLRKITTVLGGVSYLPRINCRANRSKYVHNKKYLLDQFLAALLVEAEQRRDHGLAAQLREVKRCIEFFDNDGVEVLLKYLEQEEGEREKIICNLREQRIILKRRANDMSSLEERIRINEQLTEQNLVDSLMRIFIEGGFIANKAPNSRTPESTAVFKFYDEFKYLLAQDERAESLQTLLTYLKERLLQNNDWKYATESMITRGMKTIERYVMYAVYDTAFYPNSGADQHRDKVLRASIAKVSQSITPDSIKIPKRLYGESPWPSAQAELSMLDIYVTAQDKLKCVVRTCDVINNLIALSSKNAVASADDLTPVLVFVILKANPRSLLSNVQFVETFAAEKIETGRDAYYWTNFKSAVEYIKTIL